MSETTSAEQQAMEALHTAEAAVPSAETHAVSDADMIISQWESDCLHNSPASRDTDGFNHLVTVAIPELRRRLKGN